MKTLADTKLREGLKRIAREFGLALVVLFGSRTFRKGGLKKDYDIGVCCSVPLNGDEELALICRFSQLLESDALDLVLLDRSSPLLRYEVATTGKLLYEKAEGIFNHFRWQAIQRWNDARKFYNQNGLYIKNYLKETE